MNHEDVWIEDREEIKREFHVYFVNMFITSCPTNMQIEIALAGLKPRVTAEMNEQLDMPFTEEVVLTALSQMYPTKAPRLDRLPAAFFQKHWISVKSDAISTCLHILNNRGTIAPLNHTHIVLIPKISKP